MQAQRSRHDTEKMLERMPPRRSRVFWGVLAAMGHAPLALAGPAPAVPSPSPSPSPSPQEVQFSASFLGSQADQYNLSSYERGNTVQPGDYVVDLYVNNFAVGRENISFRTPAEGGTAQACITRELLILVGVNVAKLEASGTVLAGCVDVPATIADASVSYDGGALRLDLSIPQVAMSRSPRGYVDPKMWDHGITAFTLGYSFNASANHSAGFGTSRSAYLGLNSGLNVGGWRIRNQSSLSWNNNPRDEEVNEKNDQDPLNTIHKSRRAFEFQNIQTYAQRDITPWRSQLTLGDTFTNGQLYDSTAFRGVQLATDSRMRPDSMNGYAPTVRGNAETNATVSIRQNGYIIYETTVAPGAFEINDLYPSSIGGDLVVEVTEADGRIRTFKVPYSAVPQLLRPGTWNYSATVGQIRNSNLLTKEPVFFEGTYQQGINNWLTGYAGTQFTQDSMYRSALVGAAFNTPVGAFSLDVTSSKTKIGSRSEGSSSGHSVRATFSKNIPATNTEFALAAYRYSSEGFRSLSDATLLNDHFVAGKANAFQVSNFRNQRSRFQFTVSQRLSQRWGSLFFSGSRSDYWNRDLAVDYSYQAGWNNVFRQVTYGVSANRVRLLNGSYDSSVFFNLSMPLGSSTQRGIPPQLNIGYANSPTGATVQAGVTGVAGKNRQFNYGVNTNYNNNGTTSVAANGSWRAPYATLGASYTHSRMGDGVAVSATGGVVVHGGGVTFAPQLGETIGLVRAKDAKGARLVSDSTVKVDGRGFAITSNLMPYRMNDVSIDPKGTSLDVELETTRQRVAPRAGAVVALDYATKSGKAMLLRAAMENGQAVPFGARVTNSGGQEIGLVGQGGQVFVRDLADNAGEWTVEWGDDQQCVLERPNAPDLSGGNDLQVVSAMCRAH